MQGASAKTFVHAATLRQNLQIRLAISPSHSILVPGQAVLALPLQRQTLGREFTRVPIVNHCYGSSEGSGERCPDLPLSRQTPYHWASEAEIIIKIIIIIIIIIIAFKGAISRFVTISSQRRELSPTRTLK